MSPATTGGWIANFVDNVLLGRDVDLTSESLASGVRDPAFGEDESRRGEAAQQNSAGEFAAACCDVKRV